jgi:hypothetical protein
MEAIVPFMNFFVKQCLEKPDKKTIRSYPVLSFSEKNGVWSFLLPQAQSDTCGINGYKLTIQYINSVFSFLHRLVCYAATGADNLRYLQDAALNRIVSGAFALHLHKPDNTYPQHLPVNDRQTKVS